MYTSNLNSYHHLPPLLAEEVGHLKLAAQYICRELCEADEANLLDEEGNFFNFLEALYPTFLACPSI